jgi:KDO2-lipid IV(A) lauroyltransferase
VHLVEYAWFRVLLFLLSGLTWNGARRLGRILGGVAFDLLRFRRRVTLENLAAAFPEKGAAELVPLARECYRSFGVTFLELILLPRLGPEDLASRVRFSDPELYVRVRREERGAVLLTGHLGNWELMGAAAAALGHPLTALVARQKNRRVDAYVRRARETSGLKVLYVDQGLRAGLRVLRRGEFLVFLFDQDAGRDGVFVPFFGRPASTPLGAFRFARLAGSPIILGLGRRDERGVYRVELHGPIRLRDDLPPEEAELEALREANALLEDAARRYPAQWFWMHRRWKTRPPGAAAR